MTVISNQESRRNFTLAALRVALMRIKLIEYDLEAIGVALKGGLISPETALEWAEDVAPGCLCFVPDVVKAEGVAA